MQYAMFLLMRDIHGRSAHELAGVPVKQLDAESETFAVSDRNSRFGLHAVNRPQIHHLFLRPSEFAVYRNHIGGLLLLPKIFNTSYGDLYYAEKRRHYLNRSLLPCSLHEQVYDHNPGFRWLIAASGLPFRAHAEFTEVDLNARQDLYLRLTELVWDPGRPAQKAMS